MVPRYTRPEMAAVWTDENRFKKWLDVEVYACEGWNKLGDIPDEDLKNIQEKADFRVERILEIEEEVKHDVIAFLTNVAEYVGPSSRFIHMGIIKGSNPAYCFTPVIQRDPTNRITMLEVGIYLSVESTPDCAVKLDHMVGIIAVQLPGKIKEGLFIFSGMNRYNPHLKTGCVFTT
jgi:hypothetical protein